MKYILLPVAPLAALLVAGCGPKQASPSPAPTVPLAVFVAHAPSGAPVPIPEARTQLQPGDEVVLAGRVMGVPQPFVEGRAVFILGDEATITPCQEGGCRTPWDACCDPVEVRHAGTATIQVLGEDGQVLSRGLKGMAGLQELSRVRVAGTVAPQSTPEAMIVNAQALYVASAGSDIESQ